MEKITGSVHLCLAGALFCVIGIQAVAGSWEAQIQSNTQACIINGPEVIQRVVKPRPSGRGVVTGKRISQAFLGIVGEGSYSDTIYTDGNTYD